MSMSTRRAEVLSINPIDSTQTIKATSLPEITKNINSNVLKDVPVTFTSVSKNNSKISIGFPDLESRDNAINALNKDSYLSSMGLEANSSAKMYPKLTIENVERRLLDGLVSPDPSDENAIRLLEKKTIRELLLAKNMQVKCLVEEGHTFEIVYLSRSSFGNKNLTIGIKVSPSIRETIYTKQRGVLYLEAQSYQVTDRFHIKQCFHCQLLGHVSRDCEKKSKDPTCMYCMQNHKSKECQNKRYYDSHSCANCLASKNPDESCNYRSHNSADPFCPVIARERKRLQAMTEYSKNLK